MQSLQYGLFVVIYLYGSPCKKSENFALSCGHSLTTPFSAKEVSNMSMGLTLMLLLLIYIRSN